MIIENLSNRNSRLYRLSPSKKLLDRGDTVVGIDNINDYYDVNLKYGRLKELGIQKEDIEENKKTINHSQSWIRPLFWILLTGMITEYIISNIGFKISFDYLNHTIQYMSLLTTKDMFCGNNIAFVINKIILGYLYYQFLISIRKDTRK